MKSDEMTMDLKAKECQLIVGIPGTLYYRSVSRYSTAYIELINNEWHAWRETYQDGRTLAVNTKTIAQASTFDYVLKKVEKYFNYLTRKR